MVVSWDDWAIWATPGLLRLFIWSSRWVTAQLRRTGKWWNLMLVETLTLTPSSMIGNWTLNFPLTGNSLNVPFKGLSYHRSSKWSTSVMSTACTQCPNICMVGVAGLLALRQTFSKVAVAPQAIPFMSWTSPVTTRLHPCHRHSMGWQRLFLQLFHASASEHSSTRIFWCSTESGTLLLAHIGSGLMTTALLGTLFSSQLAWWCFKWSLKRFMCISARLLFLQVTNCVGPEQGVFRRPPGRLSSLCPSMISFMIRQLLQTGEQGHKDVWDLGPFCWTTSEHWEVLENVEDWRFGKYWMLAIPVLGNETAAIGPFFWGEVWRWCTADGFVWMWKYWRLAMVRHGKFDEFVTPVEFR